MDIPPQELTERFATRRSPLSGVAVDVPGLSAPQPRALVVVHGAAPVDDAGADAVLSLGPRRWLAIHESPIEGGASVVAIHGGPSVAEDLSHGMTRLRLSGPDARSMLSAGITLDLHPRTFPPGASAVTAYRDVFVVLHATADDTYDLYVLRSFAASLWEWLVDSSAGVASR